MKVRDAGANVFSRTRALLGARADALLFVGLALGYLLWLTLSCGTLGYTRDEGFYFQAAASYGRWYEILLSDPARAVSADVVDRYWRENREHPALMKSLFWLSDKLFYGVLFDERGTAQRFPAMVLSALAVATVFAWARRVLGRSASLVAALSFGFMPQVFFHGHLACFDMPIASLWLFTTYAYARSLTARRPFWALGAGLLYGLMLNTKHNAWLLPFALVAHVVLTRGARVRREGPRALKPPLALWTMALLGPLVLYAGWPWIWRHTVERFTWYVKFHLQHVYYNMEFLGRTYFEPPFPRAYAWLMTLATVPTITLLLAGAGAALVAARGVRAWRARRLGAEQSAPVAPDDEQRLLMSDGALWLLSILVSYAFWWRDSTPIFGGTKHWLTAYPFFALFAGVAFEALLRRLPELSSRARLYAAHASLGASVLAAPLVLSAHSHPYGLGAYTPLVGGTPGAASLGLNRNFWGYTTGAVTDFINEAAASGEKVFVHDTALQSFAMLQSDGRLRPDLRPTMSVAGSGLALYHHEQHMSRVEHMIWTDYGTTAPAHVGALDGVPMVWLYLRRDE